MSATASIVAPAASSAAAHRRAPWPYALALTTAMMPGATTGPRPAPRFRPASLDRYAPMALKLDSSADRLTRAVVQRTTAADYLNTRATDLSAVARRAK